MISSPNSSTGGDGISMTVTEVLTDKSMELFEEDVLEDRFIEGLSNEVTLVFTAIICLIGTVVWYYWKHGNYRRYTAIHPQLVSDVNDFRNILQGANAQFNEENIERLERARDGDDRTCPICYGTANFAVLTNCGHIFCCECIIGYWSHSASPITPVNCAICRTPVTMLLPLEWPSEDRADDDDGLLENDIRLNDYNRRFSGERPWMEYLFDLPVLVPYALRHLTDFSVVFRVRVLICVMAVLVYILTPFDVIPESAFGILGLLDDVLILVVTLIYFSIAVRQFMARRGEVQQDMFH